MKKGGEREREREESVQKVCGPNLKPVSPGSVFMGGGGKNAPAKFKCSGVLCA